MLHDTAPRREGTQNAPPQNGESGDSTLRSMRRGLSSGPMRDAKPRARPFFASASASGIRYPKSQPTPSPFGSRSGELGDEGGGKLELSRMASPRTNRRATSALLIRRGKGAPVCDLCRLRTRDVGRPWHVTSDVDRPDRPARVTGRDAFRENGGRVIVGRGVPSRCHAASPEASCSRAAAAAAATSRAKNRNLVLVLEGFGPGS